jgi:hypothetical protein
MDVETTGASFMMLRVAGGPLGGWSRLGIVLTLLWALIVAVELLAEYHFGPFSLGLLTDMVKTGEPDNLGWVPVDQAINVQRLSLILLAPIVSMWAIGLAWAWVREGFRKPKV